ncbi:hypothetical protein THAOC_36080 [Thalassiosira oceanica]|uniref:Uncharacterized protein n=1 Tax=Thalassiosira oceanica TaxID=159749 RepID=K0R2C2_THAOC|nr:hypothetical protein THAOC_36080 [Thalassiosira oceanica]|eukprot:EJK45309.1 hypothetical protein THAOC_36080 [Thalassiosira oceanica]
MYGTATGVSDFEDFLAQQQAGTQGALCIGAYTAYGNYLKSAFPDLKYYEIENTSAGALQGLTDGHCEVVINAYIYALDFIAEQHEAGGCMINDKAIGVIGAPLGFGLSQMGVGVSNDLEDAQAVTDALSYWMNYLMTLPPDSDDSEISMFEMYGKYGRDDPDLCQPTTFVDPTKLFGTGCPEEEHGEDHHEDHDEATGAEQSVTGESAESPTPAEPSPTPDDTAGNRRLGAAAAGVLGAILGRLF